MEVFFVCFSYLNLKILHFERLRDLSLSMAFPYISKKGLNEKNYTSLQDSINDLNEQNNNWIFSISAARLVPTVVQNFSFLDKPPRMEHLSGRLTFVNIPRSGLSDCKSIKYITLISPKRMNASPEGPISIFTLLRPRPSCSVIRMYIPIYRTRVT